MKPPLRLIFDDCLSKHAVAALQRLAEFARGSVEFKHLADIGLSGQIDDDWIPQIEKNEWIAVSTDRAKKRSRGGALPLLCQKAGLSYVLYSSALHQRNMFDKVRALLGVWPKLSEIKPGSPCCGYLLHLKGTDGDSVGLKLIYTANPDDVPKSQQNLDFT